MNADEVVQELERFAERVIVKITLDAHANLTKDTPVDLGWAQAGWIPRIGLESGSPQPNPGDRAAVGALRAQAEAGKAQVLASYSFPSVVSISNNVPYIGRLNDGHSDQAPSGFVQRAIVKALTTDLGGLAT